MRDAKKGLQSVVVLGQVIVKTHQVKLLHIHSREKH